MMKNSTTQVRRIEKVSAFLTTLVVLTSAVVLLMLLAWFFLQIVQRTIAEPTAMEWHMSEDDDPELSLTGVSNEILPPGVQDFPELEEPQIKEKLQAISDLPSKIQGQLEALEGIHDKDGRGRQRGYKDKDTFTPYPEEESPWERWTIEYSKDNLPGYVQQLEHFGIQIGRVNRVTNRIDLLSGIATTPKATATTRAKEKRVFFVHRKQTLLNWDRQLLRRAGIADLSKSYVVQFIPDELAGKLFKLEKAYAKKNGIDLKTATQTVFQIQHSKDNLKFEVRSIR